MLFIQIVVGLYAAFMLFGAAAKFYAKDGKGFYRASLLAILALGFLLVSMK